MHDKYNFAFFDEGSKKEIRRTILKAVAIPGYQVPFASREMPVARGWGTGGLQITLVCIGQDDILKVIDQGSDESVNAVSIKKFIKAATGIKETIDTEEATIIQSRHRIPEEKLREDQILVLQVPTPEPLRNFEPSEARTKELHANQDYTGAWLMLFEQIMKYGNISTGADHTVRVNDRYIAVPSPIPKFDNPKMDNSQCLILLGAGREKKIHAIPPYTKVKSIDFEDMPFKVEDFSDKVCHECGSSGVFMDEIINRDGSTIYKCNDTSFCLKQKERGRLNER